MRVRFQKSVLVMVILLCTVFQGTAQEFCISTEPENSQFQRGFPALFFEPGAGFVVVWEDWRGGEYGGYAQRFDESGTPVGRNFPVHGHRELTFLPDGTNFSLSQKEILEQIDYEYVFEGQICSVTGFESPVLPIYRVWAPFCGTGFLGQATGVLPARNSFHVYVYYDGELISNQYDQTGNFLNAYSYSFADSYQYFTQPVARLFANGASHPAGNYVLTWYLFPAAWELNDPNVSALCATFFNASNEVIADSVQLAPITSNFRQDFNTLSKVVALEPARFLFVWLDQAKAIVYSQVFTDSGKAVSPAETLDLTQFSDMPVDTTYFQFYLGKSAEAQFEMGLAYRIRIAPAQTQAKFLRLNFDANGQMCNSIHSELSAYIWGDRYFTVDSQTFFAPNYSDAGNQLCRFEDGRVVSSTRLPDNAGGGNQLGPKVIALDSEHFLVNWRDEKKCFVQIINGNGERIGEPVAVSSQNFFRLTDSICVNYTAKTLTFYRTEDFTVQKQEEFSTGYITNHVLLTDGVVISVQSGDTHLLVKFDLAGNRVAQIELLKAGYDAPVLGKCDENSFWFLSRYRTALLATDLRLLRDNPKNDSPFFPLTILNSEKIIYTKKDPPRGYEIAVRDSAGRVQATIPFPLLANRNLNLRCLVIDTEKLALIWTDAKDVYSQIFNAKLEPFGEPFIVHDLPEFYQDYGTGCLAGTNLLFVWCDSRDFQQGYNVYGKFVPIKKLVGVQASADGNAPANFELMQNYPNPFNSTTEISFTAAERAKVQIFNALGQLLHAREFPVAEPGRQILFWDGRDQWGRELSSGIYFCRIVSGTHSRQIKIVLLR